MHPMWEYISNKKRPTQRDGPEDDHGFTIDVTAVQRQHIQSSGTLRPWNSCTWKRNDTGDVLQKRRNSKFIRVTGTYPQLGTTPYLRGQFQNQKVDAERNQSNVYAA